MKLNKIETKYISEDEYRQRQTLLNRVKEFWIEGFLKQSLDTNLAINLVVKTCPDNAHYSFENLDECFEQLQQIDIYSQIGESQTFLILGESGAGKTIALLQLAEKLVNQTEKDLTKPIPVVFNLSSWGQKNLSIEEWLIEELKNKYQVPKTWSEIWLKQEQLILLLDGLDEVSTQKQNDCIQALNQFITIHNKTEMIICSRVQDYEALTEKLQLSSVICIQPLSPKQVFNFLEKGGDSLFGLKTLLQENQELVEFAQNPLILNVMSLTYQDWSTQKLLTEFRSTENRYKHLFDSYIERMLRRRIRKKEKKNNLVKYRQKKVLYWLSWLAKTMLEKSKTVFLIEEMQPSLLTSVYTKKVYKFNTFFSLRIIYRLIFGLIVGLIIGLGFGLIIGLIFGIIFELIYGSIYELISGLIYGLIIGLIYGLINGLIYGLMIWRSNTKIVFREKITLSWRKLNFKKLINKLIFGQIGDMIELIISNNKVKKKIFPNQGIWNSSQNFVKMSLIYGLVFGLIFGLISALAFRIGFGLVFGLIFGSIFGLGFGIDYGGVALLQHFALRLVLFFTGCIPWNYARFFNYACDRLLMKKVGGGYVFYHRMLMEHFAQMEFDEKNHRSIKNKG